MAETTDGAFAFEPIGLDEMADGMERLNRLGDRFAATMSRAFTDVALKGKSFGDVLRGLARQLAELALQAAFKPLTSALGSAFAGLFGAPASGAVVPFASGGVVAAPTYFAMAGGRTGLMGEAGPEAIMPLTRGPDGRLGVRAMAGAGAQVTVNISTPDVESFRRSQTQIAAVLSRTVAQGQRNL